MVSTKIGGGLSVSFCVPKLRIGLLGLLTLMVGCVMDTSPAVRMQPAILLPQCSASSGAHQSSSPQVTDKITNAYSLCDYPPDAGFIADPNPHKIPRELEEISVPFGKSYDRGHLSAVLAASARSTWTYIQETFPVEVYTVPPVNYQGCQLFQEIDLAPSNVRCVFEDHDRDLSTDGSGSLQGLYWAAGYVNEHTQAYSPARAIIYVRRDATRWTLVHELMHHLFRDQRIRDGIPVYTPAQSYRLQDNLRREISRQKNAQTVSREDLERTLTQTVQMARQGMGALLQNDLEEATIEYLLYRLYRMRLLDYTVSNEMASLQYIRISVFHARTAAGQIYSLMEQAYEHLRTHGASTSQLSQLDALKLDLMALMAEAEEIIPSLF